MTTATRTIRAPRGTALSRKGHVGATLELQAHAFDSPGVVPEHVRPLFCRGKGPFRWVALPRDPEDIHVTDEAALDRFGQQPEIGHDRPAAGSPVASPTPATEGMRVGVGRERLRVPLREARAC